MGISSIIFLESILVPAAEDVGVKLPETRGLKIAGAAALYDFLVFYSLSETIGNRIHQDHEKVSHALLACRKAAEKLRKLGIIKLDLLITEDLVSLSNKILSHLDAVDFVVELGAPKLTRAGAGNPGKAHAHLWIYFIVRWLKRSGFIGAGRVGTEKAAEFLFAVMKGFRALVDREFEQLAPDSIRKYYEEYSNHPKLSRDTLKADYQSNNIFAIKLRRRPRSNGGKNASPSFHVYFDSDHFGFIVKNCYGG